MYEIWKVEALIKLWTWTPVPVL